MTKVLISKRRTEVKNLRLILAFAIAWQEIKLALLSVLVLIIQHGNGVFISLVAMYT